MTWTGDKDMDTCSHKGTCEQFADHTAAMIVAVATAAHPDDPQAAIELSLRAVDWTASIGTHRLMDTSDLDPETGEVWGVVPDGQVWVVLTGARDRFSGRSSFTAYWADGQRDYVMKLSTFEAWQAGGGRTVKVLTSQQAATFHPAGKAGV
jgi:hypothetical protein